MASRTNYSLQCLAVQGTLLAGSFAPNGASAVDAASVLGRGVTSVTRTGAGKFTVQCADTWRKIWSDVASVRVSADATDIYAQTGDFSNVGSATAMSFVVKLKTGATNTDLTANANNRVSFMVLCNDSVGS